MKIIIYGFTGSGKTTYLNNMKSDASFADYDFVDLDDYILSKYSQGLGLLSELIKDRGWEWFRETELVELKSLLEGDDVIVALGGGSVSSELVEHISTLVDIYGVYRDESFLTCWNRIKKDNNRPITFDGEERCKVLYNDRVLLFSQLEKICLKF